MRLRVIGDMMIRFGTLREPIVPDENKVTSRTHFTPKLEKTTKLRRDLGVANSNESLKALVKKSKVTPIVRILPKLYNLPMSRRGTVNVSKAASKRTMAVAVCPHCGNALTDGKPHADHGYRDLKFKLDGYLKPGQSLNRNMLLDSLYANIPKDPTVQVQVYNFEIGPGGFTGWHLHTGATFYVALQGMFEGYFEEGVLVRAKAGEVYSEPMGKIHRGHNPHSELPLLGIGLAITSPGIEAIINVEPPAWADAKRGDRQR
jgi:quercetin dioxygenase-like cupin family protein